MKSEKRRTILVTFSLGLLLFSAIAGFQHFGWTVSAQDPTSDALRDLRRRNNFEPAKRMLIEKGIPFDPEAFLERNWPKTLAPILSSMPEMSTVRRMGREVSGVIIGDKLYFPEKVSLVGDTVVIANSIVFEGKDVFVTGDYNSYFFPLKEKGVLGMSLEEALGQQGLVRGAIKDRLPSFVPKLLQDNFSYTVGGRAPTPKLRSKSESLRPQTVSGGNGTDNTTILSPGTPGAPDPAPTGSPGISGDPDGKIGGHGNPGGTDPSQDRTFVVYTGLTWAPDGKHLAFTKVDVTRPSGKSDLVTSDILVVNTNGTGQKRFGSEGVTEVTPSFSRDGKSLLFGARDEKQSIYDLYSANIDGSGVKRLPTNLKHAVSPQISPDGEKIVFTANLSDESGDHYSQIFVMKNGGAELKNLTKTDHLAFHDPFWSPDGKSIVYYATHSEMNQVWIMDSDGQNKRVLTDQSTNSFSPSWSADGKRILFTVAVDPKVMLYSIKTDGTDRRSLYVEATMGRWSPNGEKLAYIKGRYPNIGIFVANADGSRSKKIIP